MAYRYALADPTHVEQALAAALEAQQAWAACAIGVRQAVLLEVAAELARRRGDLIGSMVLDSAKTVAEADPEVSEAIDFARYYAQSLDLGEEVADCAHDAPGCCGGDAPLELSAVHPSRWCTCGADGG